MGPDGTTAQEVWTEGAYDNLNTKETSDEYD